MKAPILLLIILGLVFSGCIVVERCIDDGVCTDSEKAIGNCKDCQIDEAPPLLPFPTPVVLSERLVFGNGQFPQALFGEPDNNIEPQFYINFGDNLNWAFWRIIEFENEFDATDIDYSNPNKNFVLPINGKRFYIEPNQKAFTPQLVLFTGEPKKVDFKRPIIFESKGETYEIELIGTSSAENNFYNLPVAAISVNNERETIPLGGLRTINGLDVWLEQLVIDEKFQDARAIIHLDAQEYQLERIGTASHESFAKVRVNGFQKDGSFFKLSGANRDNPQWDDIQRFSFRFIPSEMERRNRYLLLGESVKDPAFDTEIFFENVIGPTDGVYILQLRAEDGNAVIYKNFTIPEANVTSYIPDN